MKYIFLSNGKSLNEEVIVTFINTVNVPKLRFIPLLMSAKRN